MWAEVDEKRVKAKEAQEFLDKARQSLEKHQQAASQDMGPVK